MADNRKIEFLKEPRNGDLYLICGAEHLICNGCADRISETRRFTCDLENAQQVLARMKQLTK